MKKAVFFLLMVCNLSTVEGKGQNDTLFVSKNSTGNYPTITAAIASLPMYCYQRVTIYVKNGIYNEKIKIDRDYITLVGESADSTKIEFNQLREDWDKHPDHIGPAVVNIIGDDIILKNLTIENTQLQIGPHAFAIYGTGTRTILKNCKVLGKGGDTVSLWDYKTGMYYHDSCYFQGAVDFVCPRGWCYISNSTFYELKNTAAVWHAAPTNPNQKFVMQNCNFQGADSFYLARHHYDAQFYFLNCNFPSVMRNKPVEHVFYNNQPEKNRPYLYGDRYFFYNCSRINGNYNWFDNNLNEWPSAITPNSINPEWTFDNQWNPVDKSPLQVKKVEINGASLFIWFNELVMQSGQALLETNSGKKFYYQSGSGSYRLEFKLKADETTDIVDFPLRLVSGNISNIQATEFPRYLQTVIQN